MSDGSAMAGREILAAEALAANAAFYRAFAGRDFERMQALWASGAPVTCIHPGWNAVRGREGVLASWRSILSSPESPAVACANATAYPHGESAYVVCEEHIADAVLIATNVFVREQGDWKLVHHQAGHVVARVPEPAGPPRGGRTVN